MIYFPKLWVYIDANVNLQGTEHLDALAMCDSRPSRWWDRHSVVRKAVQALFSSSSIYNSMTHNETERTYYTNTSHQGQKLKV